MFSDIFEDKRFVGYQRLAHQMWQTQGWSPHETVLQNVFIRSKHLLARLLGQDGRLGY